MPNPPSRQSIQQSQAMASPPSGEEIGLCVRQVGGTFDFEHNSHHASIFGEMTTGDREDYVSIIFQYGVSARDVTLSSSGSGVSSHDQGMASSVVNSGIGMQIIESKDVNRYRAGHEMVSNFTGVFKGAAAGVNQYLGPRNNQDAACFGTSSGQFGVWFIDSSVASFVPRAQFNSDPALWLNPEMMNLYRVAYGYLGAAPIRFSAYNPAERRWDLVHEIMRVNSYDTPHLSNPTLPVAAVCERTTTQSNTPSAVKTASWRAGSVGGQDKSNSASRWFATTILDATIVANSGNNVLTLHVDTAFGGLTSHVVCELGVVAFANDTNKTVAFYGTKAAQITSGSAPAPISSGSSVMQVSTGGYVTGGTRGPATVLRSNNDRRTDVLNTGIVIYPGETFTFEAVAAAGVAGTVSISARWVERF